MINPTENDTGRFVVYQSNGQPAEAGRITAVRPERVHVEFPGDSYSKGCRREDLTWLDDLIRAEPPSEPELSAIAERHAAAENGYFPHEQEAPMAKMWTAIEELDAQGNPVAAFLNHAWDDVKNLLAAIAARDGLLHDLQQESALYEQGRRESLAAALAAMDAIINERNSTASMYDREGDREEAFYRREQADAVTRARNLLVEDLPGLSGATPLPPDQIRAENARLRAVLRQGVEIARGWPDNSKRSDFIEAAREALG